MSKGISSTLKKMKNESQIPLGNLRLVLLLLFLLHPVATGV